MAYRRDKKSITLYTQECELTELRQEHGFSTVPANLQRWTLRRLDQAYQGFFRKLKAGKERAGLPRFRGQGRWNTFGFAEFSGITLRDNRLHFKGMIGGLRVHFHRPLPEGKLRGCTFTRNHKGWAVIIACSVPIKKLAKVGKEVGVDVGLKDLAVLSTGEAIPNLRIGKRSERKLRRRQRALARCKKGSKRRSKVRSALARDHANIKNSRRTYLHQISARLVRENDLIVIENLNVKGLANSLFAKPIHDASWGTLRRFIDYKVVYTGRRMVAVDPKHTSQICPECGQVAKKKLSQRTHKCDCGCVLGRDHAAALVILQRGRSGSRVSQREALACA